MLSNTVFTMLNIEKEISSNLNELLLVNIKMVMKKKT